MALRDLYVDGYGHFHQYALRDLGDGLVVVHGPNEAGKTTLRRWLMYLLFGPSRGERVEALAGGRPGGRATFDATAGRLTLERFEKEAPTVRDAFGSRAGEEAVRQALGGLDRALYEAVHAFALDDLAGFDRLGEAELRDRLFTGSLAGASRSISTAVSTLSKRQEALWRTRAACRVRDLEAIRAEAEHKLRAARQRAGDLRRLLADAEGADDERTRRLDEAARAEREARRWKARLAALPHHRALRELASTLAAQPAGTPVPLELIDEVGRLAVARSSNEAALHAAREVLDQRRRELHELPRASSWSAGSEQLAELHRALQDHAPAAVLERTRSLRRAAERLDEALSDAGLPDRNALARLDLRSSSLEQLREMAEAARRQTTRAQRLRDLEAEFVARGHSCEELSARAAAMPRDAVALGAAPLVQSLRRDEATAVAARSATFDVEARFAKVSEDAEVLQQQLGEAAFTASGDLAERARLSQAVSALRRDTADVDAREAVVRATVASREGELGDVTSALEALSTSAEPSPDLVAVVDKVDEAVIALSNGANARSEAKASRAALNQTFESLGWAPDTDRNVRVDAATREAVRTAARNFDGAEAATAAAEQALAEVRRDAGLADGPVPSLAEVDERAASIEEADAAIRARDEARLRSAAGANAVPPKVRTAGLGVGALLVVLGLVIAWMGQPFSGLVVAVLGGALLIASVVWLAPGGGASEPAPDSGLAARLARLGLAPTASSADVARLRAGLTAERRRAELGDRRARAVAEADRRRAERDRLRTQWSALLAKAGWPALAPADADAAAAALVRIRELRDEVARHDARAQEAERVWSTWLSHARPFAAELERPVPFDGPSARALAEAARGARRSAEAAAGRRRDQEHSQKRLTEDLATARADLDALRTRSAGLQERCRVLVDVATRLGAPSSVQLDVATDWLTRADRLRELVAIRADLLAQLATHRGVVERFDVRVRSVLVERLGLSGPEALAEAETRCAAAAAVEDAWRPVDEARARAEEALRQLDDEVRTVRAEVEAHADSVDRWREAAADAGLPADLDPTSLETFLDAARRTRAVATEVESLECAASNADERGLELLHKVATIAEAAGEPRPGQLDDARALVERARSQATADTERARAVEHLEARIRELEAKEEKLAHDAVDLTARLTALLAPHGVDGVEPLRALRQQHDQHAKVVARVNAAETARAAALGELADDEAVVAELDTVDEAECEARSAAADLEANLARKAVEDAVRSRETLRLEIEGLRGARDVIDLEAEVASTSADLLDARRELAQLVVAQALLERTLKRFREAHQPNVLRQAGRHLSTATGGIYVGVEPTQRGDSLVVVDREGGRRKAEQLSTGAAEMLYLVLRLGLAKDLSTSSSFLPLVLDDVLANVDPERAMRLADLLGEVATERQVLLLTCRPETRDMLAARVPNTQVVELPRFGGRALPASSAVEDGTPSGDEGLGQAATRIFESLVAATEPIGRQEILKRTGLPESAWNDGIRQLKDAGLVEQLGEKRGARYHVVTT